MKIAQKYPPKSCYWYKDSNRFDSDPAPKVILQKTPKECASHPFPKFILWQSSEKTEKYTSNPWHIMLQKFSKTMASDPRKLYLKTVQKASKISKSPPKNMRQILPQIYDEKSPKQYAGNRLSKLCYKNQSKICLKSFPKIIL